MLSKVVKLPRLIDLLSCGPARIFNLPGGTFREGSVADVAILDPEARYQLTNTFHSKASNSPFIGDTMHGRVVATVVGGELRHDIRVAAVDVKSAAPRRKKR